MGGSGGSTHSEKLARLHERRQPDFEEEALDMSKFACGEPTTCMHHEEEGLPVFQDLSDVALNFSKLVSLPRGGRLRVLVNKTLSTEITYQPLVCVPQGKVYICMAESVSV